MFVSIIHQFIPGATNLSNTFSQLHAVPLVVTVVSNEFDKVGTGYKYDRGQEALEYLVGISHAISSFANCFSESSVGNAFVPSKEFRNDSFRGSGMPARDIRKC